MAAVVMQSINEVPSKGLVENFRWQLHTFATVIIGLEVKHRHLKILARLEW